jgi:hypothetical protein
MLKRILIPLMLGILRLGAQNPANITFPPAPNPPYLATDSYTRAGSSINLVNGFLFAPASGNGLLNLNISSYPPYVNNNYQNPATTPNYMVPNPALEAGVTGGYANVDPMGGFNYSIPILCSPGTAGIEPQLSIAYSSNGSNNWLGQGFSLNGISVIRRSGKTVFYDGTTGGVKFNAGDVFELDGTRLLLKNGTYGQPGASYQAPVENYYNIASPAGGPLSFTVGTP